MPLSNFFAQIFCDARQVRLPRLACPPLRDACEIKEIAIDRDRCGNQTRICHSTEAGPGFTRGVCEARRLDKVSRSERERGVVDTRDPFEIRKTLGENH